MNFRVVTLPLLLCSALSAQVAYATPKLVSTILPIGLLVENIAGSGVQHSVLVPGTLSPHHYSLAMSDRRNLATAVAVFWMGDKIEVSLGSVLDGHHNSVSLLEKNGREGGDPDAHAWLDPHQAGRMANRITEELVRLDPDKKTIYRDNYRQFVAHLQEKTLTWRDRLSPLLHARMVFHHNGFQGFLDYFGLRARAVLLPGHGHHTSVRTSYSVSQMLRSGTVDCFITDATLPQSHLRSLKVSKYTQIIEINPVSGLPGRRPDNYFELMDNIVKALGGCMTKSGVNRNLPFDKV